MATKSRTVKSGSKLLQTSIDIPAEARGQMVELLNQELANLFDLFSQDKQAHWNVKGPDFYQLHELYDELAEMLLGHIDTVAERITALGGAATGTVRMAAGASQLPEFSAGAVGSMESVRMLAERYAKAAEFTREGIDTSEKAEDMGTSDLLTEVVRDLDKSLWFLEAHLQGE